MRWLFPSRTPFIPAKYYASLYRYTTAPSHLCALFPPPSAPLPRSIPSFFSHESTPLPQESENFFTLCKLLAYGEMDATQRVLLRNVLREDLVCI